MIVAKIFSQTLQFVSQRTDLFRPNRPQGLNLVPQDFGMFAPAVKLLGRRRFHCGMEISAAGPVGAFQSGTNGRPSFALEGEVSQLFGKALEHRTDSFVPALFNEFCCLLFAPPLQTRTEAPDSGRAWFLAEMFQHLVERLQFHAGIPRRRQTLSCGMQRLESASIRRAGKRGPGKMKKSPELFDAGTHLMDCFRIGGLVQATQRLFDLLLRETPDGLRDGLSSVKSEAQIGP